MRKFNDILFMGAGEYTIKAIEELRERLEEGIGLSGGLQQPDHPDSEEMAKKLKMYREKDEQELKEIVEDIAMALTGKEWVQWK